MTIKFMRYQPNSETHINTTMRILSAQFLQMDKN